MNYLLYFFLVIVLLSSCEVINPEEEIPSYIKIDSIIVRENGTGLEGVLTTNITDAWVFLNNDGRGMYEMPSTIPLLAEGKHSLKVLAGIKTNGIETFRKQYPFYDFYVNDSSFTLKRGEVLQVTPIVEYYKQTNFAWIEEFESAGVTIDSVRGSMTSLFFTSQEGEVRSGSTSGKIVLNQENFFYKGVSSDFFKLPTGGSEVYLELDYKTSIDFNIFLIAYKPTGKVEIYVVVIKSKKDEENNLIWNKIYVQLTADVSENYDAISYQVGISSTLPKNKEEGTILIDNIKLIHQ